MGTLLSWGETATLHEGSIARTCRNRLFPHCGQTGCRELPAPPPGGCREPSPSLGLIEGDAPWKDDSKLVLVPLP